MRAESIGIHWIPVQGAEEYRGMIVLERDASPVHRFRVEARTCRVMTETVELPPGRYAVLIEAVVEGPAGTRRVPMARRFEVDASTASPFASVRPTRR